MNSFSPKSPVTNYTAGKADLDEDNNVYLICDEPKDGLHINHPTNIQSFVYYATKEEPLEKILYFQGYPYSTDIDVEQLTQPDFHAFSIEQYRFFHSHEGTIIRVFNINGKWYTSTNRKLDAMRSKWASKHDTFGFRFAEAVAEITDEVFEDISENEELPFKARMEKKSAYYTSFLTRVYTNNLNPDNKYMFVLKPSEEERIVCRPEPRASIYHVGTFDKDNKLTLDDTILFNSNPVPKTKEFTFTSFQDIVDAVYQINIKNHQGLIAIRSDGSGSHFKIMHPQYKSRFIARGNVQSLRFRYIMLRRYGCLQSNVTKDMLDLFLDMYNYHDQAAELEREIYQLCQDLHEKYISIYVHKIKIALSDNERRALQNIIHSSYLETRQKTTVTLTNDLLTKSKPCTLNHLLNDRKNSY